MLDALLPLHGRELREELGVLARASPRTPELRSESHCCMRVKKSAPGRMRAEVLKGSLGVRRGGRQRTGLGQGVEAHGGAHLAMTRIEGRVTTM